MITMYGVIGDPIAHSLSPAMHNAAFKALGMDCYYAAFHVKGRYLHEAVNGARALGFGGLNVTVPHKEAVIRFVEADAAAREIGAANTIDFRTNKAYNTDAPGAIASLEDSGVKVKGRSVLVLGAGGAARAVTYGLLKAGATVTIANRTAQKAADLAAYMREYGEVFGTGMDNLREKVSISDIIVNTTTVGMGQDETLVTADMLSDRQTVLDLVYRPVETRLLREARLAGARAIDGITMLVRQGALSFEIWTGVKPPIDVMERGARDAL
ncbi:shikimate dehydrogenase [Methanocella conradii]|uniref:shikimate dehydrogenase n=1 Tax=Methanocella conradii TaxID=1175444 RepID=UPI0024B37B84|nr:shikimate dehydrogenase [Methanocella conradii]MDI6896651.1 shikimate dehydrogenase [Methanocella conradii]